MGVRAICYPSRHNVQSMKGDISYKYSPFFPSQWVWTFVQLFKSTFLFISFRCCFCGILFLGLPYLFFKGCFILCLNSSGCGGFIAQFSHHSFQWIKWDWALELNTWFWKPCVVVFIFRPLNWLFNYETCRWQVRGTIRSKVDLCKIGSAKRSRKTFVCRIRGKFGTHFHIVRSVWRYTISNKRGTGIFFN